MKRQLLLNTLALTACLLCTFVSNAYDFEVDCIYYNITSPTTVEVTHKAFNNPMYSGEVIIPSTVTYNSVIYSVIAIGDSAFYSSNVCKVTIPETVTSIGLHAFVNCSSLIEVTCLPINPPSMNESFEHHDHVFPFQYVESNYCDYAVPSLLLFVNPIAYNNYNSRNNLDGFFSWVFTYDLEKTNAPSYTVDDTYFLDR